MLEYISDSAVMGFNVFPMIESKSELHCWQMICWCELMMSLIDLDGDDSVFLTCCPSVASFNTPASVGVSSEI